MLNKRLLIKNIISNHDEGTFYDRKETVDLLSSMGKSKILKHICALANSNPVNESYVIIGITKDNVIVGTDFIDDSLFQNLVSSYLKDPPNIKYENISFPALKERSVGLLSILPNAGVASFAKSIHNVRQGTVFHRIGSKSEPVTDAIKRYPENKGIVEELIKFSRNTLQTLLDSTFEFLKFWGAEYKPKYLIFKEQFVVCWSGWKGTSFHTEVDVQIMNEGVRLFFSANQDVKIEITEDEFKIDEYVFLGYEGNYVHVPYESTSIYFGDNGTYSITKKNVFSPPLFPKDQIESLYQKCKLEEKRICEFGFDDTNWAFTEGISMYFFICYLNGIPQALDDFFRSEEYVDGAAGQWYALCKRILDEYEGSGI